MIYFISSNKQIRGFAVTNDEKFADIFSGPEWTQVSFWRYLAYRLGIDKLWRSLL